MKTARQEWSKLDNLRRGFLRRCEKYAHYTLPRLCRPDNWNETVDEVAHDWQAVGAQATNHVVNKMMLALFAPSRPFLRLRPTPEWMSKAAEQGLKESDVEEALTSAERRATAHLDASGNSRSMLYLILSHLVVLGNVLMLLPRKTTDPMQVFGVKSYAVRRTGTGKVKTLILREKMAFDELEQDVQKAVQESGRGGFYKSDTKVEHYRWISLRDDGKYHMTQWVDDILLGKDYDGRWSEDELPYRVLTWNLSNETDYGTGLVEDYAADFAGLSALSEAQIKGAILSSEFRWLVNPAGYTKVEDFETSENGAALPGNKDDIVLVTNSKVGDLRVVGEQVQEFIQRIGRGFLMGTQVTRDAERVTAEEIRMQATELETAFGGTYSRIAVDLQRPIALWLLAGINLKIADTAIEVTIVTGLDALSRSGDLDSLRGAIADMAQFSQMQSVIPALRLSAIISTIFSGHGLAAAQYVKTEEEMAQEAEAQRQAQQQAEINSAAVQSGVDSAEAQQDTQGQP